MMFRSPIPMLFGSFGLLVLSIYAAYLLMQACALQLPFLRHLSTCTTPAEISTQAALETATDAQVDLQRRIFELERELSGVQCVIPPLDANAPLSPEKWRNNDLTTLYGCWDLDTTYRTRDIDSGAIRTYSDWKMCFDGRGNGKQLMRSDDGITCEGPVTAQYGGGGLSLVEPGNLACQDGGYIHQRQIACKLGANGKAICDTKQPETGGEASVGFDRAPS